MLARAGYLRRDRISQRLAWGAAAADAAGGIFVHHVQRPAANLSNVNKQIRGNRQ
jgi:hypothetical protein